MCGLTGFWSPGGVNVPEAEALARRMAAALRHRGPDGEGVWLDAGAGIVLAHRRLAVIDLSPAGGQPMMSGSGRYVIAFNGEIYNHQELRDELETAGQAPAWRGRSDTESLLAAVDAWGLPAALQRCVGMFAFALWDRKERLLWLGRDRLGEKPLYYGRLGANVVFASELAPLRRHPAFDRPIDRQALLLYLYYGCVPAPWSIYTGIGKVRPGTLVRFGPDPGAEPVTEQYWSARQVMESGLRAPFTGNAQEARQELEERIRRAISLQMVADVPVGAFLSGGIDSSTVVALMQAQASRPVQTFTIGFSDPEYDEAPYARKVALHLGTDHTELRVSSGEAQEVVPRLSTIFDEPFADASQIPTVLICRLARQQVTVSLSGDGGDELFGGYNRYLWGETLWRRYAWMPPFLRRFMARALVAVSPGTWDRVVAPLRSLLPPRLRYDTPGERLHKLAGLLDVADADAMYQRLVAVWPQPGQLLVSGGRLRESGALETGGRSEPATVAERMMYRDLVSYLPDDLLTKVDRAAMTVSLETRIPFLDHRIVEFAWRLPFSMKVRAGEGKWLLRQILFRYVPPKLVDRAKTGFAVPIDSWLRGPLREWAEDLLSEERLRRENVFTPAPIRRAWEAHLAGRRNCQYQLWAVLMFQSWMERVHA